VGAPECHDHAFLDKKKGVGRFFLEGGRGEE